jgi:hypothetical protein
MKLSILLSLLLSISLFSCNRKFHLLSETEKIEFISKGVFNNTTKFYGLDGKEISQEEFSEEEAWNNNLGFNISVDKNNTIKMGLRKFLSIKDSIFYFKEDSLFARNTVLRNKWFNFLYKKDSTRLIKEAIYVLLSENELYEVDCNNVKQLLNKVYKEDQRLRTTTVSYLEKLTTERKNENEVMSIVKNCGFPKKNIVGDTALWAIFMVIQHSQKNKIREQFLEPFIQLAKDNEIEKSDVAYLHDRILVDRKEKQIYGTQYFYANDGKKILFPLKNRDKIDSLRASVGLGILKAYLIEEGISD